MSDAYTEDLAKFGFREINLLRDILDTWCENGLPVDFYSEGVRPGFNLNSGHVFLVNEDHQTAMMNGNKLESFYSTPYESHEGFLDELLELEPEDLHAEDVEYILDLCRAVEPETIPTVWQPLLE